MCERVCLHTCMGMCLLFSVLFFFLFVLGFFFFREKGPELGLEGGERKTVRNWERKENSQNITYKILKKKK